jgi:small subunit ribosomal protein S16
MVVIRLARGGRIHAPIYTIVATDERNPRDGRFLEKLGQYNPKLEESPLIAVKVDAIKARIAHGAQLSTTVKSLFKKHKISLN